MRRTIMIIIALFLISSSQPAMAGSTAAQVVKALRGWLSGVGKTSGKTVGHSSRAYQQKKQQEYERRKAAERYYQQYGR